MIINSLQKSGKQNSLKQNQHIKYMYVIHLLLTQII